LHDIPDEYLADAMPLAKKIAVASGLKFYNVLQVRTLKSSGMDRKRKRESKNVKLERALTDIILFLIVEQR
jgi:hypothetical protein